MASAVNLLDTDIHSHTNSTPRTAMSLGGAKGLPVLATKGILESNF
jgi:hypothetical protein